MTENETETALRAEKTALPTAETAETADAERTALTRTGFADVEALAAAYEELKEELARHTEREKTEPVRGVPLLTGSGTGVRAPSVKPATIAEAGSLALGYLKSRK